MGSNLMNSGIIPFMTLGDTCYMESVVPTLPSRTWLRAYVHAEEGLLLGVLARDFPLYLLMPEPSEGFQSNLPTPEECRKLFTALALPGALEILLYLHRREKNFYHPSAIAKQTNLPLEDVMEALSQMEGCELLKKQNLELEHGLTQVYTLHDNFAFVPFLYFARWMMQRQDAYIVLSGAVHSYFRHRTGDVPGQKPVHPPGAGPVQGSGLLPAVPKEYPGLFPGKHRAIPLRPHQRHQLR